MSAEARKLEEPAKAEKPAEKKAEEKKPEKPAEKKAEEKKPDADKPVASPAKPAVAGPPPGVAAKALRRQRARRLLARLFLWVILPTAVGGTYYGAIASDQFESVALFTVQTSDGRVGMSLDTLMGALPGSGSARDALAARDYILSRDMLDRLNNEHQFISHYQQASADWFSRLPADATREDAHEYYRDKVHVSYDTNSGVVTVNVRAYSPKKAQEFAQAIVGYSEEMVNKLSERARNDQTRLAQEEVTKAEARLVKARAALLEIQKERKELNPEATAAASVALRGQLEGELAKARAEVMQLKSYMRADAPQVVAAEGRAASLAAQVANESQRMVSKGDKGLDTSIAHFEGAVIEKEFAEKAYGSALTSLEIARTEAARQHRYLATVARPSLPDDSTYPQRGLATLTVALVSIFLFGILSLVTAAIKEHARL